MDPMTMSELPVVSEEDHNSTIRDYNKRDARAKNTKSCLRKRHKKYKMSKKGSSAFEERYSELARDKSLVREERRIDMVLVHEEQCMDDVNDVEDKVRLQQQQLERSKFLKLLQLQGFTVQVSTVGTTVYTKLFCPFKRLCYEAQRVKVEMPLKDCKNLDEGVENFVTRIINKRFETDDEDDFVSAPFFMNQIDKYEGYENPNLFFRPAVRSLLVHHILINLNLDDLDNDLKPALSGNQVEGEEQQQPQEKKGLSYMMMKKNYTDSFLLHEESVRSGFRGDSHMSDEADCPPADPQEEELALDSDPRKDLDDTWTKFFKFQPLWKIRNYFGERIAFYFAWSGMLCTTLWFPTLVGICIFFYGIHESATSSYSSGANSTSFQSLFDDFKQAFDNSATPYFGLFICVWGTVFLESWKRKRAELAYEWDVEQYESSEPDRPSFAGTRSKRDPVTEEWVWYYPFKRQCMKFCFSFSILIVTIVLVVISVLAVITYRIVIEIDYCPQLNASECLVLSSIVSSVLNAISILLLSKVYDLLAKWLTDWENHRTQTKYDDALIFKLFAFQFVNNYSSCFYIAFFQGNSSVAGFLQSGSYEDTCGGSCMTKLSFQVMILMLTKPLPKLFKDVVIVWVLKKWKKHPNCCKCLRGCLSKLPCCKSNNQIQDIEADGGHGKQGGQFNQHLRFLQHEHHKPSLGDFTLGEYMEKVIQYGFLMLFATSFPLAPLLALLTNLFDLRVDARRLLWWYRRPMAFIAQDIGMWFDILLFVNFVGVVSNAFIIAFTSSWGDSYSTAGKLIIVIGFEHIVFVLKYAVAYLIPDVPARVQLSIRREQFQIQKKLEASDDSPNFSYLYPGDDSGGGDKGGARSHHTSRNHLPKSATKGEPAAGEYITYLNAKDRKGREESASKQNKGWETVEEVETAKAPGMRVHSATYRP